MKFEEVLPVLREGKKIRRTGRKEDICISIEEKADHYVRYNFGSVFNFNKSDFENDDWEIVKETKKVKLRDLSKRKYVNWWYRHCFEQNKCEVDCPLKNVKCDARFTSSWIDNKDLYSDKFLDQEIEVEE